MKRIIDGKTYNTSTSTLVAEWSYEDSQGYDVEATLYQTRGGAFFAVHEWEVQDREGDRRPKGYAQAMSRDEVQRLVERGPDLTIYASKVLDEPPEAVAEETPAASIYTRMPIALKDRIEVAADTAKLSVNAWMIRCAERCLDAV